MQSRSVWVTLLLFARCSGYYGNVRYADLVPRLPKVHTKVWERVYGMRSWPIDQRSRIDWLEISAGGLLAAASLQSGRSPPQTELLFQ